MGDTTITSHQPHCQTLARYAEYQVDNYGLIPLKSLLFPPIRESMIIHNASKRKRSY